MTGPMFDIGKKSGGGVSNTFVTSAITTMRFPMNNSSLLTLPMKYPTGSARAMTRASNVEPCTGNWNVMLLIFEAPGPSFRVAAKWDRL
ncbi:hypothetical protein PtB15_2B90 [Puccinia triticina]|nr:hypothetical protein PtB15_2B90 [Puccinia triticina]